MKKILTIAVLSSGVLGPAAATAQVAVDFDGSHGGPSRTMRPADFLPAPAAGFVARPAVHREAHKVWEQAELERFGYELTPRGIEKNGDPNGRVLSLVDPADRPEIERIAKAIAEWNHVDGDSRFIPRFIEGLKIIQPCLSDHSLPQCGGGAKPVSASRMVQAKGTLFGSAFVGHGDILFGAAIVSGSLELVGIGGEKGRAEVSGLLTLTGSGFRGSGFVRGSAEISGEGEVYDADGKFLGSAKFKDSIEFFGSAQNGNAAVLAAVTLTGFLSAPGRGE